MLGRKCMTRMVDDLISQARVAGADRPLGL